MKTSQNKPAFMALDVLFGIIVIGIVTVALVGTVRHERLAENSLADSRSALHLAEHALLNLQHGQPIPNVLADVHLTIHPVNGGVAPAGFAWAKVEATVHGHHQSLLGVVPVSSLPISDTKS